MSGGQRRRLDIAMGLIHEPTLVFLDEPTTGLDPQARANLWEHIAACARERGATVFLTTHYLDEADALCDRILVIDHGVIVASDTPEKLKAAGVRRPGRPRARRRRPCRDGGATGCGSSPADVEVDGPPRQRPRAARRQRGARACCATSTGRRRARLDRGAPADARRRVPHPHRPLAARRRGRRADSRPAETTTTRQPAHRWGSPMNFVRDSWIVFCRQLRMNLRNPAWVIIGMLQPILYLVLFGPLLEPLVEPVRPDNAYTFFVPGPAGAARHLRRLLRGFGLIAEWREGVIEAERVTPASRTALLLGRLHARRARSCSCRR